MTNIELFKYSGQHPEPIFDPSYNWDYPDTIVIPQTADQTNTLVEKNAQLIELISAFGYLTEHGKGKEDPDIQTLVSEIITILTDTEGINLSPFAQFFMVYNSSYSSFRSYPSDEKREFVYEMLRLYSKKRHRMYLSHGYTNSILQVVCDSHSHKRKSKTTIDKVCDILERVGFVHKPSGDSDRFYFLPDKGDKDAFLAFKEKFDVVMESAKNEQGKLPDMVFFINGEYYIVEMKSMKGCGGGQDKQMTEVNNFICSAEKDSRIHYMTYLDGEYSNLLHDGKKRPKIKHQYEDAVSYLTNHPGNYFLNTAGFEAFVKEKCPPCPKGTSDDGTTHLLNGREINGGEIRRVQK